VVAVLRFKLGIEFGHETKYFFEKKLSFSVMRLPPAKGQYSQRDRSGNFTRSIQHFLSFILLGHFRKLWILQMLTGRVFAVIWLPQQATRRCE